MSILLKDDDTGEVFFEFSTNDAPVAGDFITDQEGVRRQVVRRERRIAKLGGMAGRAVGIKTFEVYCKVVK